MPIRRLPTLLVNQIAAGEVIERPASVVKELVENSLDAGATRVDIAIEDGGRQLVRVSDDGMGIAAEELPLAVAPHATSKLTAAAELASIATLGFRGEALASIASVSRLRISSRAMEGGAVHEAGAALCAEGDVVGDVTPAACAPGTVIEVRDLFYNTPARRKFLRGAPSEFGHITDIVGRIAMVHPHVGFTLTHGGRSVMDLPATTSRLQRCIDVLGRELAPAVLECDWRETRLGGMPSNATGNGYGSDAIGDPTAIVPTAIWALAGMPAIARATAKFQHLYVNGRPIRDRNLAHAVREAYRGLVPFDRFPVAVVVIDMDPHAVDVNVHPAKAEVRFRDPNRVHGQVLAALRQRLLAADLTPTATIGALPIAGSEETGIHSEEASTQAPPTTPGFGAAPFDREPPRATPSVTINTTSDFVDYFRRMAPQQKGFVYQEVRRALEEDGELRERASSENAFPGCASAADPAQQAFPVDGRLSPMLRSQGVLQVHKSYLVTQDEQGILIVDQHALHERVMFEELRRRVLGHGSLESQRLLMPAVLDASPRRIALLDTVRPLLERIGVEVEPIGPGAMAIHAFPSFLFDRKVEPVEFMTELLDRAEEGQFDNPTGPQGSDEEAVLHRVLDMMACKAAVKAGDTMKPEELAALLARRDEIERASNCPHGRPTTIRLTLRELERQFKRT